MKIINHYIWKAMINLEMLTSCQHYCYPKPGLECHESWQPRVTHVATSLSCPTPCCPCISNCTNSMKSKPWNREINHVQTPITLSTQVVSCPLVTDDHAASLYHLWPPALYHLYQSPVWPLTPCPSVLVMYQLFSHGVQWWLLSSSLKHLQSKYSSC